MSKLEHAWHNPETDEVHTPRGRIVYPNLLEPRGMKGQPDSKPRFSVTLLLPATANIDALKKLAGDTAAGEFGQKWQEKRLRSPFLATKDYERLAELAEKFPLFVRLAANVEFPPFIFGPDAKRFAGDASEIYSGRWAVAAVRAYAYDNAGNKGVSFGLQRIQLLDHDEPIAGGRVETASGFESAAVSAPTVAGGTSTDALWG